MSAHIRLTATDSAGCGSISSELVQIDVLDDWGPGIVQSSTDELCFGDGFDIIAKGPSGADNDFSNLWYVALDGGAFSQIDSLSTLSWAVVNASQDYDVFLESTSNFGCGTLATEPIHVEVLDSISAPQVAGAAAACTAGVTATLDSACAITAGGPSAESAEACWKIEAAISPEISQVAVQLHATES